MYDNEREKQLREAPYRKIAQAEELVNANALLDLYIALYKKKFRGEPIFPVSNEHLNMIKSFGRASGSKAYELLQHFFEMRDEWFQKQAYSIACLMNNLNKVNASYSQKAAAYRPSGTMQADVFCDHCWEDMVITVPMNHNFDKTNCCDKCKENRVPPKRVSQAERRKTILKLGAAFPELPWTSEGKESK